MKGLNPGGRRLLRSVAFTNDARWPPPPPPPPPPELAPSMPEPSSPVVCHDAARTCRHRPIDSTTFSDAKRSWFRSSVRGRSSFSAGWLSPRPWSAPPSLSTSPPITAAASSAARCTSPSRIAMHFKTSISRETIVNVPPGSAAFPPIIGMWPLAGSSRLRRCCCRRWYGDSRNTFERVNEQWASSVAS